ncbi:MAG: CPBP family intramembrane metalloprotease [Bacteroidetes bacterium]|nr:CPBP family intramembrane metalloprotease [Bacteroidota bacterium]
MSRKERSTDNTKERSLGTALRAFMVEARREPRDVVIVFLAVAVVGILSYQYGSKRFFYDQWYGDLSGERLYDLYQYLYWFTSEFVLYFLLLIPVILFLHRKRLRDFGVTVGDWRFGLRVSLLFYAVMLPILWVVSASASFQDVYPHSQIVRGDWTLFLIYEAAFILYFIGWEFIWRGYMLFGLLPYTGATVAVLAQMIPFVILHYGKPMPETFGAIVAGIALGALSVRTRSFLYAVLIHWSVMLTIDLLATLRFRSAIDGIGPAAFIDVFSALLR